MASQLNSLAGQVGKVSRSMQKLGVDIAYLETAASALQLIGGMGQAVRGLIAVRETYNAVRAAEGGAQLLKWGPAAVAVGALAVAGGVAMGEIIERTVNVPDNGAGIRMIQMQTEGLA